jgi:protein gp37
MAQNSKIEWTDHTFNPWQGCMKVSPGCANCYAEARDKRFSGGKHWGKGAPRLLKKDWRDPVRWNQKAAKEIATSFHPRLSGGTTILTTGRPRVFCASLADWLDDEVPIEWLARLLKLIHDTPNLDWLLLTKRPQNWRSRVEKCRDILSLEPKWITAWLLNTPPSNIWLGTSVEDQKRADERIPELLKIPARIRFLSVEPILEAINFSSAFRVPRSALHWVIFGGESGPGARPCNIEWIRDGVRQCRAAGVAPFVKQLGSNPIMEPGPITWPCKDPKGGDPSEWPADLRIREFPTSASTINPQPSTIP